MVPLLTVLQRCLCQGYMQRIKSSFSITIIHYCILYRYRGVILLLCFFILCSSAWTAETPTASITQPDGAIEAGDSIDATLERRNALDYDPTRRSFFPDFYNRFRSWREKIYRELGLEATMSYDTLGQEYFSSDRSEGSGAGEISFSARWLIFGSRHYAYYEYLPVPLDENPIYISCRIRNRHAYGDFAPSQLSSSNGLIWRSVDGFTDAGFQIPDLYISQELLEGSLILRYGQFAIDNFFDNHNLGSAKKYFLNTMFSNNPAVGFPGYGAGFSGQWQISDEWDFSLGASNMQGTDRNEQINFHLTSTALFYALQAGHTFTGLGNHLVRTQLMLWDSQNNDVPCGNGASFTVEHEGRSGTERYVGRLAFANGELSPVDLLFMAGYGREIRKYDQLGLGIGVGRSSEHSDRWQGIVEMYYRWQVTKELMITPDVQIIAGEGLSGDDAIRIIAGLRGGLTF